MSVWIHTGGVNLHVARRGPTGGLPVVFLHGFPLTHEMWEPQMAALADRCDVLAPDMRGHGRSETGDGQFTIETLVDDLERTLDALHLERVVGCGLSMGGYVLLRALERAPDRFRAAVLVDTRTEPDDDAGKLARAAGVATVQNEGADVFVEGFVERLLGKTSLEQNPTLRADLLAMMRRNTPKGICGALLALGMRTDTAGALRSLQIPSLVVVGEEDVITPPAGAARMAALAGSKLEVIPKAGHMSNLEKPDDFNRILSDFLAPLML
jgi:pimeloyl-ACP methyl ester carboxylesterase